MASFASALKDYLKLLPLRFPITRAHYKNQARFYYDALSKMDEAEKPDFLPELAFLLEQPVFDKDAYVKLCRTHNLRMSIHFRIVHTA